MKYTGMPSAMWMLYKKKFTDKDIAENKKTAALKAADRNPYSWNMDFLILFLPCAIWTIQ